MPPFPDYPEHILIDEESAKAQLSRWDKCLKFVESGGKVTQWDQADLNRAQAWLGRNQTLWNRVTKDRTLPAIRLLLKAASYYAIQYGLKNRQLLVGKSAILLALNAFDKHRWAEALSRAEIAALWSEAWERVERRIQERADVYGERSTGEWKGDAMDLKLIFDAVNAAWSRSPESMPLCMLCGGDLQYIGRTHATVFSKQGALKSKDNDTDSPPHYCSHFMCCMTTVWTRSDNPQYYGDSFLTYAPATYLCPFCARPQLPDAFGDNDDDINDGYICTWRELKQILAQNIRTISAKEWKCSLCNRLQALKWSRRDHNNLLESWMQE